MKKQLLTVLVAPIIMLLLLFSLSGCDGYSSYYKAMELEYTNTTKNASMSFSSFEGTMVFKLKCDSADEKIYYSASLEDGTAKVFYDSNGTKTELFSLNSGDEINEIGEGLQKGTVYIIVEMHEEANEGNLNFEIR